MTPRGFLIATFYALAAVALVSIAVYQDSVRRSPSTSNRSVRWKLAGKENRVSEIQSRILSTVEFGVLANKNADGHARQNGNHIQSPILSEQNSTDINDFVATEAPDFDYPWLPSFLRNGWIFLIVISMVCLLIAFAVLGTEKISQKWSAWSTWFETSDDIRVGLLHPLFFIFVNDGLFDVVGPIFVLRVLELDVALLGALVFAEHAVQVVMNDSNDKRVDDDGHKAAQQFSVKIFLGSSLMLLILALMPVDILKSYAWVAFGWYFVCRMLVAWAADQFDSNYNAALMNSSFLPPADAVKTLDIFYAANMLGALLGALGAGLVAIFTNNIQYSMVLPLVLFVIMYFAVEQIEDKTFPPDPAEMVTERLTVKFDRADGRMPAGSKIQDVLTSLGGEGSLTNFSPIWFDEKPRWLLIQFLVILILFTTLQVSFTFLLPLVGMTYGYTDEDVAFLVAVPSVVGLSLFWLGSAFDHVSYVTKTCVAAAGFVAAYWRHLAVHQGKAGSFGGLAAAYGQTLSGWASLAHTFVELFGAAMLFALCMCYSCDLIPLIRICYLHAVTRHRCKGDFHNVQEFYGHLVAFNAPLLVTIVSIWSVGAALLIWGLLGLLVLLWVGLVIRGDLEAVTAMDQVADGDAFDQEASAAFDAMDANKDGRLTVHEVLAHLQAQKVGSEAGGTLVAQVFRLADRSGDGFIDRKEFRKSYAAIKELLQDDDGDGIPA